MPSRRFGVFCGCAVLVPCSRAAIVLIITLVVPSIPGPVDDRHGNFR
ncbi:MAG: hypothetical protein JWN52_7689 [Actinomycetia bacterium]|nr:hypothetical protein [Actinomycetes bacterium]